MPSKLDRRRRWLVYESEHVKARTGKGLERQVTLPSARVGRHGDHGFERFTAVEVQVAIVEQRAPELFQVAGGEIERRKSSWADLHRLFRCQSAESALDRANRCGRALFQDLYRGPAKAHGLVIERCNSGYVV
jgi:hypothetical protein